MFWNARVRSRQMPDQSKASHLQRVNFPPRPVPRGAGVYIFQGAGQLPLYIGKSVDIRTRVLAHLPWGGSAVATSALPTREVLP